jgi:hypothetical protein
MRGRERCRDDRDYQADRAERSFCQVEPENRLVARSLDARWEARLAVLAEAEQSLEAARDAARVSLPAQLRGDPPAVTLRQRQ